MESIRIEVGNLADLEILSKEFNIPKKELIAFHNQHCSLHEILPDHLPKYIKYLYIPADIQIQRKDKIVNSRIDLPDTLADLTYGVLIKDALSGIQMHYLVDIQREYENKVSFTKRKMYVDDQELELMMEKLIESASEALYPLDFSLKKDGKIDKILNGKEIRKRWEKEYLPKIKQYYVGSVAEEFIDKLNGFYENIDEAPEDLYTNIFYPIFFLPLYTSYPNYEKEESLSFNFSGIDQFVSYAAHFSMQKTFTEQDQILIHVTGEEEDNGEVGGKRGSLNVMYRVDKNTKYITSVEAELSTFYRNEEIKIYIEIYQQKSYI
ncbi:hypothetical protein DRF65_26800 [Chryseobacterium pennae]|uniref:LysM domain-containing protein n=1 Tax=Chryseobacterium pennae TaxID=2258962 RepID=A0A3D9C0C2_9FLAO|nr:hypothetical protein [Chryseobacterium pennae]REC59310.1 hypothetical protein DRF65_26800 [Chryseobacterium pennae]